MKFSEVVSYVLQIYLQISHEHPITVFFIVLASVIASIIDNLSFGLRSF